MDDITHCPRCGSSDIAVEPIMRGSSDGEGVLRYWRCAQCNGIVSRLTPLPVNGFAWIEQRSAR